jgi:hypothetical protein
MTPGKIHGGVEWGGVLEPKRGLPREKGDALQPIEIV